MTETTYAIQYRPKSHRGDGSTWIVREDGFLNLEDARGWLERVRATTHEYRLVRVEITEVE